MASPSRTVALLVLVVAVLGGCRTTEEAVIEPLDDGDDPTSEATAAPSPSDSTAAPASESAAEPSPEPSPSPSDEFAVPDEITPEYAERVINEISRLTADVLRQVLAQTPEEGATIPPEDSRLINRLYAGSLAELSRAQIVAAAQDAEAREGLAPPERYGQVVREVEQVLLTEPCLVVRARPDFSQTDASPQDAYPLQIVALQRREPNELSRIPWAVVEILTGEDPQGDVPDEEMRALGIDDVVDQLPETCR